MPSPLPPEMLDLIVDFLHNEPDALKACCLASKPWVHRTRQHLFVHVEFSLESHVKLWEGAFPDPSNSPACYTRSLTIRRSRVVTSVGRGVGGWIRTFSSIIRLHVDVHAYSARVVSFVPLRGLSPTLKSLRLAYGSSVPPSETFGLVCSFPLLEDLALRSPGNNNEIDGWNIPSTSPKLTGCLDLGMTCGIRPAVDRLLELPSGLHFSKISVSCLKEYVEPMMDLVSECSETLESLSVCYYLPGVTFLSPSVVGQYLTTTFGRSQAQRAFARSLQVHETQGCGVRVYWIGRPADHHDAADRRVHQPSTDHYPIVCHRWKADCGIGLPRMARPRPPAATVLDLTLDPPEDWVRGREGRM